MKAFYITWHLIRDYSYSTHFRVGNTMLLSTMPLLHLETVQTPYRASLHKNQQHLFLLHIAYSNIHSLRHHKRHFQSLLTTKWLNMNSYGCKPMVIRLDTSTNPEGVQHIRIGVTQLCQAYSLQNY